MTLITRLITKERVIFLADDKISYGETNIPSIYNAIKIVKHENCLIGQSGTNDFGPWVKSKSAPLGGGQYTVIETIQEYFKETNTKLVSKEALDKLMTNLVSTFEPFHNVNTAGNGNINIQLLISYLEPNNKLMHTKIEIRKSDNGYKSIMEDYKPIDSQFEVDINLDIYKEDFLKILHETSNIIYEKNLNSDILNNMDEKEIIEFGTILYKKYNSQYNNPTVGQFYMHGDLICKQANQ